MGLVALVRRVLSLCGTVGGAGYILVAAVIFASQRRITYPADARPPPHPGNLHPSFSGVIEMEFTAEDGVRCFGWHWRAPARTAAVEAAFWLREPIERLRLFDTCRKLRDSHPGLNQVDVLFFHGNGGNRQSRLVIMFLLRHCLGVGITVVDYRGYGGSEGQPTEAGLIADGFASLAWLRRRSAGSTTPRKVVLWGESIGGGVAIAVASREHVDGVVLEGGFSSAADIGAATYPWLPVKQFMLDQFDSTARAAALPHNLPVLHLHGTLDRIAPLALGKKLFAALPCEPKRFAQLEVGHSVH